MLTPQEVQDKRFEKAVIGGYVTLEVDTFMEQVTEDYAALYKENVALKGKLKVLVSKVEEYRSVDEAMRQQLFEAQKKADALVQEAQARAAAMLRDAQEQSRGMAQARSAEVGSEEKRLELAKRETADFVRAMRELCQRQLKFLGAVPEMDVAPRPQELRQDTIDNVARDIENSLIQRMSGDAFPFGADTAQPAAASAVPAKAALVPEMRTFEMKMGQGLTEVIDEDQTIWQTQKEDTLVPPPRFEHEALMFGYSPEVEAPKR